MGKRTPGKRQGWVKEKCSTRNRATKLQLRMVPKFTNLPAQRMIQILAIGATEEDRDNQQDRRSEYAGLRTHAAPGEPTRSIESGVEQAVIGHKAAIGHAVEKGLSPVPSRVESHSPPQIAGAA